MRFQVVPIGGTAMILRAHFAFVAGISPVTTSSSVGTYLMKLSFGGKLTALGEAEGEGEGDVSTEAVSETSVTSKCIRPQLQGYPDTRIAYTSPDVASSVTQPVSKNCG
jgi:hypothetical protein